MHYSLLARSLYLQCEIYTADSHSCYMSQPKRDHSTGMLVWPSLLHNHLQTGKKHITKCHVIRTNEV